MEKCLVRGGLSGAGRGDTLRKQAREIFYKCTLRQLPGLRDALPGLAGVLCGESIGGEIQTSGVVTDDRGISGICLGVDACSGLPAAGGLASSGGSLRSAGIWHGGEFAALCRIEVVVADPAKGFAGDAFCGGFDHHLLLVSPAIVDRFQHVSQWRRDVDRSPPLPAGLVSLGDALRVDPVFSGLVSASLLLRHLDASSACHQAGIGLGNRDLLDLRENIRENLRRNDANKIPYLLEIKTWLAVCPGISRNCATKKPGLMETGLFVLENERGLREPTKKPPSLVLGIAPRRCKLPCLHQIGHQKINGGQKGHASCD